MSSTERVDWTTVADCPRCWEHGPFLPFTVLGATDEDLRDAHQAWHMICAEVLRPAVWLLARLRLVD